MPGDAALSGERIGRALRLPPGSLLLLVFPLAKLLAHLLTGSGYGYHRDELYYLVCADHLDWGYVDHPPFSVAILAAVRAVAGDSVRAIRVVPALAGALTVLVVGLIARRLGGGAFACALAMACALAAPVYLALGQYYSMNAFDLLAWAVVGWLLVLVFTGGRPSLWLIAGVVLGLGLLNKASVLWLVCGLFVGMLATPQRSWLRTRWPWIAGGTALAMVLPHVLWQWKHGFPTALFVHNAVTNKMVPTTILGFLWGQVDTMLWPSAFIWGAGLVFLIGHPAASRVRALGIAYLVIFAFLALSRSSRMAYLSPAYTWLLPAGGVVVERALRTVGSWARAIVLLTILWLGATAAPVVLPILAPAQAVVYARRIGASRRAEEKTGLGALPEFLSHMCGWDEIVAAAARSFAQIPPEERGGAAILAPNYGVAAAIDVLGRRAGLPPALSGHNNYWIWGPRGQTGDPMIIIGRSEDEVRGWFEDVRRIGETDCGYCMPYENHQPIWIGRGLRRPLRSLWPSLQYYQ